MEGTVKVRLLRQQLSFTHLSVQIQQLGGDYQITVTGGDKPHIGCAVLAIPRPSLTGKGTNSATSSVFNVTGHKDEEICRYLAEKAAKKYGVVVMCSGGFHVDQIEKEQIDEVLEAVRKIGEEL
jgi:hypothetical protein